LIEYKLELNTRVMAEAKTNKQTNKQRGYQGETKFLVSGVQGTN